ncbi:hypothetical protein GCM10011405_41510 [Rufibacter glacialis]|nr:hypothetical protein GCM10011405_41510 [Rufibacter glacialis]
MTAFEEGKLLGATQVLLDPAQKATAHFRIPVSGGDLKKITFTVEDPATPFDNEFFIVLPKPSVVQIKVNRAQRQKDPVVQALQAEPAFVFANEPTGANGFWVLDIPTSGGSASLANQVKNWVDKGGSVLLIPQGGEQKGAVGFLAQIGLAGISEANQETGALPLRQPDFSDTFFRQIFEKEVRNMKMPEAVPVLTWRSAFHTILKFSDNSPFLSTFKVGKGNVHLLAAPISASSAFVAHPLFVPVLYQLALGTTSSEAGLSHQSPAGNLSIPLEGEVSSKQPFSLAQGDLSFIPDQRIRQNQLFLSLPPQVNKPGFYNLEQAGKAVTVVAMNIPRTESKLEAYTVEELKELLADHGGKVQVVELRENVPLQKQLQNEVSGPSLWKYCLILCFLCLVIEAIILSTKKSGSPI